MCKALDKDADDQEYLVQVVASAIESAVEANDKKPHQLDSTSFIASFYGTPPPISAHAYIKRIYKYGGLSPCNLVVALVLIERLYSIMGENKTDKKVYIPLRSTSFQRMYLTAAMISSKFEDGYYYSNAHWAEVAGIPLPELNRLELKFLFGIAFQVQVHRETYDMWCRKLTELVRTDSHDSGDGTQLRSQGMNRNLMRAAAKWSASKPKGYRPWRAGEQPSSSQDPNSLQREQSWEGSEASAED
ncbi:hypothetical protein GUITHDRAFT_101596 [Guillardia theta CCMP2712]|uniref:Cyclin n=1 Tax=Guillardia theta (strain CCMP2712) TaxID=905079 RepID=L1JVS7_GUITC|nr:hypothetical protein GUITHDRAFT_101596 [Guillardia theta CCMP2712]EKX52424.1 hypothetical protein GUITHDRAFT_101596 [Guillardia theta CCMP2712]|eukprot:XP_005839404.1 hypothetical protein GUITHDRAFT_101596 [Guillardia theta CCMP2712]